ncbi:hypothetical protein BGZ63DRAFT_428709 [Mariannaea sp. PMI_226]|nr:hypothetical protein BGZ63DRAFT_428709 [Mariannaea sp. PMI_226]
MSSTTPPASSDESSPPTHTTWEVDVPFRGDDAHSPQHQPQPQIRIPRITPLSGSPADLATGLEGKYVDEFGNILDWDGTVLGRVDGDLPSMIGRPVSASGQILDQHGETVGHVSENYSQPKLKPLGGGLQVDDEGIIYDEQRNVVGRLNSPINDSNKNNNNNQNTNPNQSSRGRDCDHDHGSSQSPRSPAAPRPDEIYLDVKSTFDGIQLVIKIPTVFNRGK